MYQNAGRCIGFHLQSLKILIIIITTPKGGVGRVLTLKNTHF